VKLIFQNTFYESIKSMSKTNPTQGKRCKYLKQGANVQKYV